MTVCQWIGREIVWSVVRRRMPRTWLGVLPGVVDGAFAEVGDSEAVGGFEDLEGGGFERGEVWVGFEDFGGALVLGFDPGDGASP